LTSDLPDHFTAASGEYSYTDSKWVTKGHLLIYKATEGDSRHFHLSTLFTTLSIATEILVSPCL
jgi:hypothetical protein